MFENRQQAGELLAERLKRHKQSLTAYKKKDTVVLAIPRGGVVVGKVIAQKLNLPLDIIVVKKIGAPSNPELAIGAVGPGNVVYWDNELCQRLGIEKKIQNSEFRIQNKERKSKERILRGNKEPLDIKNKTVILVDDGVATGATVIAAQKALQKMGAVKVILAVPVISKETFNNIKRYFDSAVVLSIEEEFYAVGQFYRDFPQVSDNEVIRILNLP